MAPSRARCLLGKPSSNGKKRMRPEGMRGGSAARPCPGQLPPPRTRHREAGKAQGLLALLSQQTQAGEPDIILEAALRSCQSLAGGCPKPHRKGPVVIGGVPPRGFPGGSAMLPANLCPASTHVAGPRGRSREEAAGSEGGQSDPGCLSALGCLALSTIVQPLTLGEEGWLPGPSVQ